MSRKLPIPTKQEIEEIYEAHGGTISSVARHFNTSNPTVRNWLKQHGIEIKSHKTAIQEIKGSQVECPDVDKLREMLEAGDSLTKVRKHFGVTYDRFKRWEALYGLTVKPNKFGMKDVPSKEFLESELKKNQTYQAMSESIGVSLPTMMKWLREYGLTKS